MVPADDGVWGEAADNLCRAPPPATAGRTLGDLLADWLASDSVTALETSTRDGYRKQVDAVRRRPQHRDDRRAGRAKEPEIFECTWLAATI